MPAVKRNVPIKVGEVALYAIRKSFRKALFIDNELDQSTTVTKRDFATNDQRLNFWKSIFEKLKKEPQLYVKVVPQWPLNIYKQDSQPGFNGEDSEEDWISEQSVNVDYFILADFGIRVPKTDTTKKLWMRVDWSINGIEDDVSCVYSSTFDLISPNVEYLKEQKRDLLELKFAPEKGGNLYHVLLDSKSYTSKEVSGGPGPSPWHPDFTSTVKATLLTAKPKLERSDGIHCHGTKQTEKNNGRLLDVDPILWSVTAKTTTATNTVYFAAFHPDIMLKINRVNNQLARELYFRKDTFGLCLYQKELNDKRQSILEAYKDPKDGNPVANYLAETALSAIRELCKVRGTTDVGEFRDKLDKNKIECKTLEVDIGLIGGTTCDEKKSGKSLNVNACPLVQCYYDNEKVKGTDTWRGQVGNTQSMYNVEHIYMKIYFDFNL